MDPETIELAVADFMQEQLGGAKHPNLARRTKFCGARSASTADACGNWLRL